MTKWSSSKCRIAVVGNMNNAGFTLMRYFRDLGADAHLLLWANDGMRSAAHFRPEADTWQIERWQPYIHRIGLSDSTASVVPDVVYFTLPPRRKFIRQQLSGFDYYVGSGAAPAIFERAGLRLDVFWPYSVGVEWLDFDDFRAMRSAGLFSHPVLRGFLNRPSLGIMRRLQARGIRHARYCFNAEMGPTRKALADLGKTALPLALPAVYSGPESAEDPTLPPWLARHHADLDPCNFRLFCAARWLWDSDGALSIDERNVKTKNSDMLLRGLAEFRRRAPGAQVRLFTFEYGSSVEASKRLAAELGLSDVIVWLPTMERRELTLLMSRCDVVVGEFYIDPGVIWGSTGWESLAAGKPLIHSFNFGPTGFSDAFGYPPPPILDAKSPAAVADQLMAMFADPGRREQIGAASVNWFHQHNGINLARRWLDVLTS